MSAHDPPRWRSAAACLGYPVSWFYPERGEHGAGAVAMSICRSCSVAGECLDDALDNEQAPRIGILGGVTSRRRNELARRRRLAAASTIDAIEATETIVSKPTNEAQVRPLHVLPEPVIVRPRLPYAVAL